MISARLSKDGKWLLCGNARCGFRLGQVVPTDNCGHCHIRLPRAFTADADRVLERRQRQDTTYLFAFTNRASKKLARLKRLGTAIASAFDCTDLRRSPNLHKWTDKHGPLPQGQVLSDRLYSAWSGYCEIVCPLCDCQQTFDNVAGGLFAIVA